MIKKVTDSKTFLEICDKLDYVKDCKLSKSQLYAYMIAGDYNEKTSTYVSYDNEMNGCIFITIDNDINGDLTLFVIFVWIDPHYRKLRGKYMKFIEEKAKEYNAVKISFTTARSEKAIERQLSKYGYKKKYSVIEKEMI